MTPRLIRRAMWLGLVLSVPPAVVPASGQDQGVCGAIGDAAARSSCIAVGGAARAPSGMPSVRAVVEPVTPGRAEAVDGRIVARAPNGYVGRALAMRGGDCRYIDVNRYVCTVGGAPPVEIYARVIMPPSAQVAVEAGDTCEGHGKVGGGVSSRRQRCRNLLFFTPSAVGPSGGPIVLTTASIWIRTSR